jgi:hypothetical protein
MQQFYKFITWRFVSLNMFRAPPRPSSGAYNCINLWFYRRSMVVTALLVVVCQTTSNNVARRPDGKKGELTAMCFRRYNSQNYISTSPYTCSSITHSDNYYLVRFHVSTAEQMRSAPYEILRSVECSFRSDVSAQPIGSQLQGSDMNESTFSLRKIKRKKMQYEKAKHIWRSKQ